MLSRHKDSARIADIASRLGVTKASTCNSIGILQREGYLDRTYNRRVVLTGKGMDIAERMVAGYNLLFLLFNRIFGVDADTARLDAGAAVHLLSQVSLQRLDEYVKKISEKKE